MGGLRQTAVWWSRQGFGLPGPLHVSLGPSPTTGCLNDGQVRFTYEDHKHEVRSSASISRAERCPIASRLRAAVRRLKSVDQLIAVHARGAADPVKRKLQSLSHAE